MFATFRVPIAAAAIAVVAAVAHVPGPAWAILGLGNAALIALLLIDRRRAPLPTALQLQRSIPPVLAVGRTDTSAIQVHNPSARSLRIILRDTVAPSMHPAPDRLSTRVPPFAWASVEQQLAPSRRGEATIGPVTVRTTGPLGLGGRQARIPVTDRVRVYPALPSHREVQLRAERSRLLQTGERSAAVRGGGTDFDSLRDYHPDDEFRRINWRATARAAKPITNLYREDRNQQVMLLLDASRATAGTVAGFSRFEHALDAAIAVAELAGRVGDHVGVVAFDSKIRALVGPRGGRAQPRAILDSLFALEPSLEAADYAGAFTGLLSRHRRRSLLILLTEIGQEATMEPLVVALPALLRRHLVMVGSVTDPELEEVARTIPRTSEEGYVKAAATGALAERLRVAGRLARMGVTVVDAPPGTLPGRLVDRYARIKALGRL